MKAKRATPRRRKAPQEKDAAWWTWATQMLAFRSGERCEHCGRDLNGRVERHHRMRRRDGGDRLSNLLFLLPVCHTWITEHPAEAVANGWIVEANGTLDPAEVPVRIGLNGALFLLDDHGGRRPVP